MYGGAERSFTPQTVATRLFIFRSKERTGSCCGLVGKRFTMYMTDPEIRRFAIEELMQAYSKSRGPARLTKAQYEVLAAFFYHVRQYVHFSELAAQGAGLTQRQYQALLAIKGFPKREEITIGELAEQLHIAHYSAVGLVNRLVEQNLIARKQSVEDRRQVNVELTERGEEVLEQLVGTHRREIRRLGPSLEIVLESLMRDHTNERP